MPAYQGVWLEQEQQVASLLSPWLSRLLDLGNKGSEQEFLEAREGQRTLLSAANNGELLAQEQDFRVFLIERLPNNAQEDNELVKRIPKHE